MLDSCVGIYLFSVFECTISVAPRTSVSVYLCRRDSGKIMSAKTRYDHANYLLSRHIIWICSIAALDRDTNNIYILLATASDGTTAKSVTVTVQVLDVSGVIDYSDAIQRSRKLVYCVSYLEVGLVPI